METTELLDRYGQNLCRGGWYPATAAMPTDPKRLAGLVNGADVARPAVALVRSGLDHKR